MKGQNLWFLIFVALPFCLIRLLNFYLLSCCRVRTSSGTFLRRGRDKIVRDIEKRIADYTFIPVGMRVSCILLRAVGFDRIYKKGVNIFEVLVVRTLG